MLGKAHSPTSNEKWSEIVNLTDDELMKYIKGPLNLRSQQSYNGFSSRLKLVRTPLNVYLTAFKSSFLSLYAHINSDECHA